MVTRPVRRGGEIDELAKNPARGSKTRKGKAGKNKEGRPPRLSKFHRRAEKNWS